MLKSVRWSGDRDAVRNVHWLHALTARRYMVSSAPMSSRAANGDGRRAATVAGAVIGSALGHDAAARRAYRDDRYYETRVEEPPRAYTVERCDVRYQETWEERVEGYRVAYEYHGRRYETRLPYDPGERVRVRVDVFPDE